MKFLSNQEDSRTMLIFSDNNDKLMTTAMKISNMFDGLTEYSAISMEGVNSMVLPRIYAFNNIFDLVLA
jgi:hypothetical protein